MQITEKANIEELLHHKKLRLASPLSRIVAAGIDVLLLLLAHSIIFIFSFAFYDLPSEAVINTVSLIYGWLYLLISWSVYGATPGQRLLKIQILTLSGERISWQQALIRCLGYALSSIPLKGGFIPIFWDPLRQGWHDRLAKTIVTTNITNDTLFQRHWNKDLNLKKLLISNCPQPNLAFPAKNWGWVLLAYLIFALVWSYPLPLHFTTHRAGTPGDGDQFLWNYWYFKYAQSNGLSFINTNLLFYPNSISLSYHTMHWFGCILAVPLLNYFNLTTTFNILFIFSLVASAFSLYWMTAAITQKRSASFVVGLALGFSSFFIAHGQGHMNLISAQFIPWCFLFFYASLICNNTTKAFLLAGISALFFALSAYCDWYHAVFCVASGVTLLIVFCWNSSISAIKRYLSISLMVGLIGSIVLLPILIPTLSEKISSQKRNENYMNPPYSVLYRFKGEPTDYLKPNPLSSFYKSPLDKSATYVERSLSPGYLLMLLALPGILVGYRKLFPWLWVIGIALILSCGYTLSIRENGNFSQIIQLLLGGAPGTGFGMPWNNSNIISMARYISSDPASLITAQSSIDMPFGWIQEIITPLKAFKVAARFGLIVTIGIAIFAALGLSYLQEYWKSRFSSQLIAGIGVAILFIEYCAIPYPIHSTEIPPFYHTIAKSKEKFAIVDVPLRSEGSAYQYFQTLHNKPIFAAMVSREPKSVYSYINNNAILNFASNAFNHKYEWETPFALLKQHDNIDGEIQKLKDIKAKYIVMHKRILPENVRDGFDQLMKQQNIKVVWDDKELRVYLLY